MDIDKILDIIKRKVLKGTHLPLTIKEIQAGYLNSLYFKDIYKYLAQNELPSKRHARHKVETLSERFILLDSLLFKLITTPEKGKGTFGHTRGMCRQNYHSVSCIFVCRTSGSDKNLSNH